VGVIKIKNAKLAGRQPKKKGEIQLREQQINARIDQERAVF